METSAIAKNEVSGTYFEALTSNEHPNSNTKLMTLSIFFNSTGEP